VVEGNHITLIKIYWNCIYSKFLLFTLIFCLLDITYYLKGQPETGHGSRNDVNEKLLTGDKFHNKFSMDNKFVEPSHLKTL
jgi:hypothetical protein